MLQINRLNEYLAECLATILSKTEFDKNGQAKQLFNYATIVVDDSELSNILKEREESDNSYLIAVMPEFNMKGEEDKAEWQNMLAFFILDKTDYSVHDRDSYINIFATTQIKANAFIDKLLSDKADHSSMFCNFLAKLDEDSITVKPVWKKQDCNGWIIEFNFTSPV